MNKKFSRRRLLKALAAVISAIGLNKLLGLSPLQGAAQEMDESIYLPVILKGGDVVPTPTQTPPPSTTGKVVHVHSEEATFWDFGNSYYGDYVDQEVINTMVDRGVMELTNTSSFAQAWRTLIPNYSPGKAIAIKVNFNNCWQCNSSSFAIDALIHPINAIVQGMLQAYPNFNVNDIWIYDATATQSIDPRQIPQRFKGSCGYPGVRFFDQGCSETASYTSTDPTAAIIWHNPTAIPTPPAAWITDILVNAPYLINIPIMKKHMGTGITLSFKNHFGSIANCAPLHHWTTNWGSYYGGTTYSPLVDIYRNEHILGKTILTIGDALFGNCNNNTGKPLRWRTFGNDAPNSLFFSRDPVAIDCVMCDFLHAEEAIWGKSDDYLVYAANCGLGTYERGDPWGDGYNQINYLKIEM